MSGDAPPAALLPAPLAHELRLLGEFHRWASHAEGTSTSGTFYGDSLNDTRKRAWRLANLCERIVRAATGGLPGDSATLILAGRMYRRSADYVKACEYYVQALEMIHGAYCS